MKNFDLTELTDQEKAETFGGGISIILAPLDEIADIIAGCSAFAAGLVAGWNGECE